MLYICVDYKCLHCEIEVNGDTSKSSHDFSIRFKVNISFNGNV